MRALAEDIGTGDISTELVSAQQVASASLICNESAILCGAPWVDEVFAQLGNRVDITWHFSDGDHLAPKSCVCTLKGPTKSILSGERTAINYLQTLSATATSTRRYVDQLAGTGARLLDTRKTIPGMRRSQKYAVRCGGGENHRMGLYDMILLKENHIAAIGGIPRACELARSQYPDKVLQVEVETLSELAQALSAPGVDRILLDNFTPDNLRAAIDMCPDQMQLEASGNIDQQTISRVAKAGVHCISVGAITKNIAAIDFSLRVVPV